MLKNYYSIEQAKKLIVNGNNGAMGISTTAIHELIRRGKLSSERLGARHLIPKDEIERRNNEVRKTRVAYLSVSDKN